MNELHPVKVVENQKENELDCRVNNHLMQP